MPRLHGKSQINRRPFAKPIVTLSIAVAALLASNARADTVVSLTIFSLLWSLGFHCWVPLEQSMALAYSPDANKGRWLGQLRSVQSGAWLLAIGICWIVFDGTEYYEPLDRALEGIRYEGLFVLAGLALLILSTVIIGWGNYLAAR